jgi:hypothetical protein
MAVKNRTVEILGSAAKVTCVTLYPQPDGACAVVVAGVTRDSEGRAVALREAQLKSDAGQNAVLDDFLNIGLAALLKINGLEDAAVPLEPVASDAPVEPAPKA